MAGSVEERLAALRGDIEAADWDGFAEKMRSWKDEAPDNPWLDAGLALAEAARGDDAVNAQSALGALDARMTGQAALLDAVRAGDRAAALPYIEREISYGNHDPALMEAFRWAAPGLAEPAKFLFSAPHLVAGCILVDGEITSMASKGSRMSAESLGQRADQIRAELAKLNERIDIGVIESVELRAEDGGWVLAAGSGAVERMTTALTAASSDIEAVSARAQTVLAALEDKDG